MKKINSTSHALWLELLNQKATCDSTKNTNLINKQKDKKLESDYSEILKSSINCKYKSQEEYYDEIILLKRTLANLKGENEILKSKLRKSDDSLNKKEKELTEAINCFDNQKSINNSSVNNFIIIKKLQQTVFQLKSEIKIKESEILNIKSDMKYTKINEINMQNEIFQQEIRCLQQIIKNFRKSEVNDDRDKSKLLTPTHTKSLTSPTQSKSASLNEKYKLLQNKYKEVINENKSLKKDKDKISQEEIRKLELKHQEIKKTESSADFDRLKKQCIESVNEKNRIEKEFENINHKYETLQNKYELKLKECDILKKDYEQKIKTSVSSTKNKGMKSKVEESINKDSENKNNEIIQNALLGYLNREVLLQENLDIKPHTDTETIVISALAGYISRENLLHK